MNSPGKVEKNSVSDYKQFGYTIVRQALDKDFLDSVEQAVFRPFSILGEYLFGEKMGTNASMRERQTMMCKIKVKTPEAYINAMRISQNDPAILMAGGCPEIISAVKGLGLRYPAVALKPYPIMVSSKLAIEGGYNLRPPHQEWPVMQGSHNGVVTWFPLHDISSKQSSLEIYPGSHLRGVLPYEVSRCGSRVTDTSIGEPVQLDMQRGDIVLFSAFSVHKSGEAADELRASVSIRFNDIEENSFVSRGYSDNASLVIKREPMDDLFHEFEA